MDCCRSDGDVDEDDIEESDDVIIGAGAMEFVSIIAISSMRPNTRRLNNFSLASLELSNSGIKLNKTF
jgi:hypothetical protein